MDLHSFERLPFVNVGRRGCYKGVVTSFFDQHTNDNRLREQRGRSVASDYLCFVIAFLTVFRFHELIHDVVLQVVITYTAATTVSEG